MKKQHYILNLLMSLVLMLTAAGCISDGDETISLEFGSAKKMIVGRWKLGNIYRYNNGTRTPAGTYKNWRPGTVLVFFADGTYTDSSDGGNTTHRWKLGTDYSDDRPYDGGINLDGDDYDIDHLGPHHWVIVPDDGDDYEPGDDTPHWELGWDHDDDGDDDGGDEPDPGIVIPPDTAHPGPTPVAVSLVRKVTKTNANNYTQTWTFSYDSQQRVTKMETDFFTFLYSYPSSTEVDVMGYGNGIYAALDAKGRITAVKAGGQAKAGSYAYDDNGYLREASTLTDKFSVSFNTAGTLSSVTDVSKQINGTFVFSYEPSTVKNDANLDLNCFVITPKFENGLVDNMLLFAPMELFGKRSATIVMTEWENDKINFSHLTPERDSQGRLVKLTYYTGITDMKETVIDISYQ